MNRVLNSRIAKESTSAAPRLSVHVNRVILRYAAVMVCLTVSALCNADSGYAYSQLEADAIIAGYSMPNCAVKTTPFTRDNKRGLNVKRECDHPDWVKSVSQVYTDSCNLGGYGGFHQGGGCMGYYVTWAYACDGTYNTVGITTTTWVARRCQYFTQTTKCDGSVSSSGVGYLDLSWDCSYITKSPCPMSQTLSSCNSSETLPEIYPICDGIDPCCESKCPCCPSGGICD